MRLTAFSGIAFGTVAAVCGGESYSRLESIAFLVVLCGGGLAIVVLSGMHLLGGRAAGYLAITFSLLLSVFALVNFIASGNLVYGGLVLCGFVALFLMLLGFFLSLRESG